MSARLEAIWIKRVRRGPMDSVQQATLRAGSGIVGNADQRGRRQVTLIDQRAWDSTMEDVGAHIDPGVRRANLLVSGIALSDSRGRTLQIGDVRLRINGETRPCERMDDVQAGLRVALQMPWRGGAFAEVLDDGEIHVGDEV